MNKYQGTRIFYFEKYLNIVINKESPAQSNRSIKKNLQK